MKKLVIFDMDGTMLDTEAIYLESYVEAFAQEDIVFTPEEYIAEYAGQTEDSNFESTRKRVDSEADAKKIFEAAEKIRGQIYRDRGVDLKKGLLKLLDELKERDIKIYVASSSDLETIQSHLKNKNLMPYVSGIVAGDQVDHSKPHPEIFLKALEKSGFKKSEALIIEDSIAGVEAGYRSGIDTLMVPDLVPPSEVEKKRSLAILKTIDEALAYIS